jgi:outer membrane lipase/esterase
MNSIRRLAAAVAAFLVLCSAGGVHAAYSNLFVFGDSLSDPGNNAIVLAPNTTDPASITNTFIPSFPYAASGQYSNSNVWTYQFAAMLGLSADPVLAGGTNFAFGGAKTGPANPNGLLDPAAFPPSLLTQVDAFLASTGSVAPSSALYVVAGGGNNARDTLAAVAGDPFNAATIIATAAAAYASDVKSMVDSLQGAGAASIIVWNAPNLGLAPAALFAPAPPPGFPTASETGTLVTASMNMALAAALAGETDVTVFDLFGLITAINANPNAFGLLNATDACIGGLCDTSKNLFWDGIHPTDAGHRIIADAMYAAAVPEPSTYALLALGMLCLAAFSRRRRA